MFNLESTFAYSKAKDHSCEVSLQYNQFFFNFHGYHGNGGHSQNFQTLNAHLHIPMIIPVMFHYNQTPKKTPEEKQIPHSKTTNYLGPSKYTQRSPSVTFQTFT
jgi:hypothetical protein